MPTCDPRLLSPVMQKIVVIQPKRVLELGIGMGKWGVLLREYTDVWWGRMRGSEQSTVIDGIEIFEGYRNPLWDVYDSIKIGNVLDLLPWMPDYDIILCLELLEHLPKAVGISFIQLVLKKCNWLFLSYTNSHQGAAWGNEHEKHISTWAPEEIPNSVRLASFGMSELMLIQGVGP